MATDAVEQKRPTLSISSVENIFSFSYTAPTPDGPNLPEIGARTEKLEQSFADAHALDKLPPGTTLEPDARFGAIVRPKEDELWAHKHILEQGTGLTDIQFSALKYPLFDTVVVAQCGIDSQGHPRHPAFAFENRLYLDYAPLRRNLAMLRNYLMCRYGPTGGNADFNQAMLKAMAHKLGRRLRGKGEKLSFIQRILAFIRQFMKRHEITADPYFNRFIGLANVPDRGAAFMYNYLRDLQANPDFMKALPPTLPKDWRLLPLEQTPFSAQNMLLYSYSAQMGQIINAFDEVVRNLRTVDDMAEEDKEESIEHARNILKNLRIIAADTSGKKEFDVGDPRVREAKVMLQAAMSLKRSLAALAAADPSLLQDPAIQEAEEALSRISYCLKIEREAVLRQEARPNEAQQVASRTAQHTQPQHKIKRSKESVSQLLHRVETGINRAHEKRQVFIAKHKQKSIMAQAMKQKTPVQEALNQGLSVMSSPQIQQVSLDNQEFIRTVKELNEPAVQEPQKTTGGGQSRS